MGSITRTFANNITTSGKFDATDLTGTLPAANIANASCTNITAVPSLTATSTVSSDPPSPDAGQMWYNTATKQLKGYVLGSSSWATGGTMNTARAYNFATAGTQTAALNTGGNLDPGGRTGKTESYNGSSWTEVADLNDTRYGNDGAGTQTAMITMGGNSPPYTANTEIWDGSSWTEVGNLNTGRSRLACAGTSTATIAMGGNAPPVTAVAETWNGSSWTEVGDLNTARSQLGGAGTSTAALGFGGYGGGATGATEVWNGSAWTEVADHNTARYTGGSGGTSTSALWIGGEPKTGKTEVWNGTSWSEDTDLSTARQTLGGCAPSSASGLACGGDAPPGSPSYTGATEEWTGATNVTTVLGAS